MEIYKIEESGSRSMGFTTFEKYFQHEADARKAFDAKIKEYRKNGELAKKSDLDGENPIRIKENPESFGKKVLREAWISVWDRYDIPEEGTDWDIGSLRLQIIVIDVA